MAPELPITTERLVLRGFTLADLDDLVMLCGQTDAQRYLTHPARDRADIQSALDAMGQQKGLNRPGDVLCLAVVRQADRRLVGKLSLTWTDATAAQAELNFLFAPSLRTQTDPAEALRTMLDLAFESFGFHRVFTRCGVRSEGSIELLKRLGMRLEAHYREHALFQGEWDEELHFAVLDREWLRGSAVKELNQHRVA